MMFNATIILNRVFARDISILILESNLKIHYTADINNMTGQRGQKRFVFTNKRSRDGNFVHIVDSIQLIPSLLTIILQ